MVKCTVIVNGFVSTEHNGLKSWDHDGVKAHIREANLEGCNYELSTNYIAIALMNGGSIVIVKENGGAGSFSQ